MRTRKTCALCGKAVDDESRTFEQRLVEDEDFCAQCWNEIMHDGREPYFPLDLQEGVKVPWAS